jgi:hypothetical protein
MSVGGVERIESSVGTIVGVLINVGVTVGNAVAVKVDIGMDGGVRVGSSSTGTGATWARGVQALMNKNRMTMKVVMCFIGLPPGDEMNCCFNGRIYVIVPKPGSHPLRRSAEC